MQRALREASPAIYPGEAVPTIEQVAEGCSDVAVLGSRRQASPRSEAEALIGSDAAACARVKRAVSYDRVGC